MQLHYTDARSLIQSAPPAFASMLEYQSMRNLAALLLGILCLISVACVDGGVELQESQQGEWSNFHDLSHKTSEDARTPAEKPAAPEK